MSGTKSNLLPYKILSAGDLSQATVTTNPTNATNQDNIAYQVNISGSPVGVIDVETCSDYSPSNSGNWTALGSVYQATVNGAGSGIFDLNQLGPCFVRLKYTKTSGTGSMDVYISGKQV